MQDSADPTSKSASTGLTCPKCGAHQVHRSKRRGTMESTILKFLLLRPYRCHACNFRYVDFAFKMGRFWK